MLILLSVCLLGTPSTCREDRITLSLEQASPMACLLEAQPLIAQWQETHVQWHVERWRCTNRNAIQSDI